MGSDQGNDVTRLVSLYLTLLLFALFFLQSLGSQQEVGSFGLRMERRNWGNKGVGTEKGGRRRQKKREDSMEER